MSYSINTLNFPEIKSLVNQLNRYCTIYNWQKFRLNKSEKMILLSERDQQIIKAVAAHFAPSLYVTKDNLDFRLSGVLFSLIEEENLKITKLDLHEVSTWIKSALLTAGVENINVSQS
ncbi:MAG: hypothetical protein H0X29_04095 [Parachlamydiaceae bacterium]|nr:hypothetical protein [Parachlamydiaceae bacterium]